MELVSPDRDAQLAADRSAVLLDVRTPAEFTAARIEGAFNANWYLPGFADLIGDLDPTTPTIVYCRSGVRSADAAVVMVRMGFTDVYDVAGGIIAWCEAGHRVEQNHR